MNLQIYFHIILKEHPEKLGIACDYYLVDDYGKKFQEYHLKKPVSVE